jgi:hypothetical protein
LSLKFIVGFILAIISESLFGVVRVWYLADVVMSVIEWIWSEGSICEIWETHEWLSAVRSSPSGVCSRSEDERVEGSRLVVD